MTRNILLNTNTSEERSFTHKVSDDDQGLRLDLFLARELQAVEQRHEEHEVIEVHWLPFAEAVAKAGAGEIRDAKTIIGLFRAQGVMGKSS